MPPGRRRSTKMTPCSRAIGRPTPGRRPPFGDERHGFVRAENGNIEPRYVIGDDPHSGSNEPHDIHRQKEVASPCGRRLRPSIRGPPRGILEVNAQPVLQAREFLSVLFAEATTGDGNRLLRFRSSVRGRARGRSPASAGPAPWFSRCSSTIPALRHARRTTRTRPRVAWCGDITFFRPLPAAPGGPGRSLQTIISARRSAGPADSEPQDDRPIDGKRWCATSPNAPAGRGAILAGARMPVVEREKHQPETGVCARSETSINEKNEQPVRTG